MSFAKFFLYLHRRRESVAVKTLEAFSFFQLVNFDNLPMNKWKSEGVLPSVMIVMACAIIRHTRV